jgi:hypothetical protein
MRRVAVGSGDPVVFNPHILRFVALAGGEARRWAEEYQATGGLDLEGMASGALALLRQGRQEEALALLRQVEAGLRKGHRSTAIRDLLERWHASVVAYLHYRNGDYDAASRCLGDAEQAIRRVVESAPFLVPFAHHLTDFRFQRARIARNLRRWREMREHLDQVQGMLADRQPFCVLRCGRPIGFSAIRAFYESLPLTPDDRETLRTLLDDDIRIPSFARTVVRFHAALGGVIPYP